MLSFVPPHLLAQSNAVTTIKKDGCGCGGDCCEEKEVDLFADGTFLKGVRDGMATGLGAGIVGTILYSIFKTRK